MKKLWDMLVLVLALNFLIAAGGVGWLYNSKKLDKKSALAIKEILFPTTEPSATTQPAAEVAPQTQPVSRLDALLAKHTGVRSASEQVAFLQQSFDAERVELDQRQRQLDDLQTLVASAQDKVKRDRDALDADRNKLSAEQQESARLASDKGFQDSLSLYNSLPAKQVKAIFLTLDDAAIAEYLQAMQPRAAAKIVKEFKSPEELDRMHRVLDKIRPPQDAGPTTRQSREN